MERQPISREGYDKIREEIRVMEDVDMPAITERIKTAREEGDLKENAEYHAARETQGYLQAKINQLKSKLSNCFIVERNDKPKDSVVFGATVKVKDLSFKFDEVFESMISQGLKRNKIKLIFQSFKDKSFPQKRWIEMLNAFVNSSPSKLIKKSIPINL